MMNSSVPALPSWLAQCLVPESDLALAHNETAPELLALCKHTLAVQHVFFGEAPDWDERRQTRSAHGFCSRVCGRPADWTLVVFDAEYASAPRLLAALMPAFLARVPLVLCASTPGPARPELLCALELAGQEDIYALNAAQSLELLHGLTAQAGQGRLVFLHRGSLSDLRAAAGAADVPCWEERRAPVLRICGPEPDAALIRLAHPDAASAGNAAPDALYRSGPDAAQEQVPLILPPGMEGCWLHTTLTPDFFRVQSLTFSLAPGRPDIEGLP
ncbi:MAG: hypothetical protein LBH94_03940 [Deltaproteobacteria bacterium]|jgi:hypothetical protein|nr:hypothetical protein [Deltaproteobacteria bacterium]